MCEPSQCILFGTGSFSCFAKGNPQTDGIGRSVESVSGSTKEKYHVKRDKLQKSQQALDAVGKEQITLYERYGKREIQREEYIEFREELQKKEDFIKSEIQEQEMRLAEVETEFHAELPDAHIIWKECKINELNQEVVDTFIKKINVWDEQHMEIIWNFSDGKE